MCAKDLNSHKFLQGGDLLSVDSQTIGEGAAALRSALCTKVDIRRLAGRILCHATMYGGTEVVVILTTASRDPLCQAPCWR